VDVGRLVAGQEDDRLRDLVRGAQAARRRALDDLTVPAIKWTRKSKKWGEREREADAEGRRHP
jgi:hypothetical protein